MNDLLKMMDLTSNEILEILDLADKLKDDNKKGIEHKLLKGKTLGMIFEKSSTRTRVSFEVGMFQLGGHALFLSSADTQLGRGEPISDTASVLSRYLDIIMIRTFKQETAEELAKHANIPVINGLTDLSHPCQILADFMTIREKKGELKGLKICFIGDGNNMMNSTIVGALKVGMAVSVACPIGYEPPKEILTFANEYSDFSITNNPMEAAKDADVLVTDVYASMGQESESEKRLKDFSGFQINANLMSVAKNDAIVLHCLPAHKEEEISTEIFNKFSEVIFDEAENRMHAQKAVILKLMNINY